MTKARIIAGCFIYDGPQLTFAFGVQPTGGIDLDEALGPVVRLGGCGELENRVAGGAFNGLTNAESRASEKAL